VVETTPKIAKLILGFPSRINDPFAINSKEANVTEQAIEVAKGAL
jgi:hypothetical protein